MFFSDPLYTLVTKAIFRLELKLSHHNVVIIPCALEKTRGDNIATLKQSQHRASYG